MWWVAYDLPGQEYSLEFLEIIANVVFLERYQMPIQISLFERQSRLLVSARQWLSGYILWRRHFASLEEHGGKKQWKFHNNPVLCSPFLNKFLIFFILGRPFFSSGEEKQSDIIPDRKLKIIHFMAK